jgi:hypothetical protein
LRGLDAALRHSQNLTLRIIWEFTRRTCRKRNRTALTFPPRGHKIRVKT